MKGNESSSYLSSLISYLSSVFIGLHLWRKLFSASLRFCVSAMTVSEGSRAPVRDFACRHLQPADVERFIPRQLVDAFESHIANQIAVVFRGDDAHLFGQSRQRGPIQVIEMRVRDQDQVELWQIANFKRRGEVPPWPTGRDAQADTDSSAEDRVGEDGFSMDAQQHRRVTDP